MPFVNEVVSDADIDRYGLPFEKGSGRYWTRDAERDFYLWGGKVGNPAFGVDFEGQFHLYIKGVKFFVCLEPGEGSFRLSDRPFVVRWIRLKAVAPRDLYDLEAARVRSILRESLKVYGRTGRNDMPSSALMVVCDF
jgi:hypothetical protein